MNTSELRQAHLDSLDPTKVPAYERELDELDASNPEEHSELQKILASARSSALKRDPMEHHIVVHPNAIIALDAGREGFLHEAILAIVDEVREQSSVTFFVSPNPTAVRHGTRNLEAMSEYCPELYTKDRIMETVMVDGEVKPYEKQTEGDTGQISLGTLDRFFKSIGGLHPEDTFRIHGGFWSQCQRHTALQLSHALMGTHVPHEAARVRIGETLKGGAHGESVLPVRYGQSVDIDGSSYESTLDFKDEELIDRLYLILKKEAETADLHKLSSVFDESEIKIQISDYLRYRQDGVDVVALFHDSSSRIHTCKGSFNALDGPSDKTQRAFEKSLAMGIIARATSSDKYFMWQKP